MNDSTRRRINRNVNNKHQLRAVSGAMSHKFARRSNVQWPRTLSVLLKQLTIPRGIQHYAVYVQIRAQTDQATRPG